MKRRNLVFCMFICFTFLYGCGETEGSSVNMTSKIAYEERVEKTEIHTDQNIVDALEDIPQVEISRESLEIEYDGSLIIKFIAASEDIIYLGGTDAEGCTDIHKMKYEEATSESLQLDLPKEAVLLDLETDILGNAHVFWSDALIDGSVWQIWVIDSNGNISKKLDITEAWAEGRTYLSAAAIDAKGRYYLKSNISAEEILVLNAEGKELNCISLWSGLGIRKGFGRGRDGQVYAGVTEANGDAFVALLDGEEGKIDILSSEPLPNVGSLFLALGAGTDTDILLYGPGTGIIAYDTQNNTASNRVWTYEFPVSADSSNCVCFLPDGRMVFLEGAYDLSLWDTNGTVDHQVAEGTKLHYIPAGK